MAGNATDDKVKAQLVQLASSGYTITSAAKELGIHRATASKYWPRDIAAGNRQVVEVVPKEKSSIVEDEDGKATITLHTEQPIRTLQDATRVAEVDTSIWYINRWECSQWTVPMKVGKDNEPIQMQQYRVKVFLKRIVPRAIRDAMRIVLDRLKDDAPKWPKVDKAKATNAETYLGVIGLMDVHFGKLCWAQETGSDYDLKIAERIFKHAVEDMLAESRHRQFGKFLIPIGNDWLHIDNRNNQTTRGTPQDTDGRFSKVFATAKLAALWAVETAAAVAPVQVVWVPGNHDTTLSEMLCHIIDARFHHSDRVTVDAGPSPRKYFHWGANLLGLTHGDREKPEDLPNIMATERPAEWANSTCREWLLGHQHRSRRWVTKPIDTFTGCTVRVIQSLSGTDAWHHANGYVGSRQAAEFLFFGREHGYAGHSVVMARSN